jgi:hypothetical protein
MGLCGDRRWIGKASVGDGTIRLAERHNSSQTPASDHYTTYLP